jgi:hypothetical protein
VRTPFLLAGRCASSMVSSVSLLLNRLSMWKMCCCQDVIWSAVLPAMMRAGGCPCCYGRQMSATAKLHRAVSCPGLGLRLRPCMNVLFQVIYYEQHVKEKYHVQYHIIDIIRGS